MLLENLIVSVNDIPGLTTHEILGTMLIYFHLLMYLIDKTHADKNFWEAPLSLEIA